MRKNQVVSCRYASAMYQNCGRDMTGKKGVSPALALTLRQIGRNDVKSEKGASSVLVMVVLFILMFLSVLAFVSTGSAYRMSKKNAETTAAFYTLDGEAQRQVARVQRAVKNARVDAEDFLAGRRFLDQHQNIIPGALADKMKNLWLSLSDDVSKKQFMEDVYPLIFTACTEKAINGCQIPGLRWLSGTLLTADAKEWENKAVQDVHPVLSFRLLVTDEVRKNARVEVLLSFESGKGTEELTVQSWRLMQDPFAYQNKIRIWDGQIK